MFKLKCSNFIDSLNIKSNSGFSLVEVLVSFGLTFIVAAAMSAMLINMQKQNNALQQKLLTIEYEQSINRLMADNLSCNCMFTGITWPTTITANTNITLTNIKNGCQTGAAANLISSGQPLTAGNNLKVSSIKLDALQNIGTGKVASDIVIEFDASTAYGPLKPVRIKSQGFNLSGSTISSCMGVAGADTMCASFGGTWTGGSCNLTPPPSTTCSTMGGVWNGSTCTMTASPSTTCSSMGGNWNGSTCTMPTTASTTCSSMGGNWNGTSCTFSPSTGVTSSSQCVATYGTGWTWNGSTCIPPGSGQSCTYTSGAIISKTTTYPNGSVRPTGNFEIGTNACSAEQCVNGSWVCILYPPYGSHPGT